MEPFTPVPRLGHKPSLSVSPKSAQRLSSLKKVLAGSYTKTWTTVQIAIKHLFGPTINQDALALSQPALEKDLPTLLKALIESKPLDLLYPRPGRSPQLLPFDNLVNIIQSPSIRPLDGSEFDKSLFAIDALLRHGFVHEARSEEEGAATAQDLRQAFNSEYVGHTHIVLLDVIARRMDPLFATNSYYGPTIHVVQSSGTGKSRMVQEAFKHVPGLTICFRDPNKKVSHGYPLGDDTVTSFFSTSPDIEFTSPDTVAAAFLGSLFSRLVAFAAATSEPSFWKLLLVPSDDAKSLRKDFFQETVENARDLLLRYQPEIAEILRDERKVSGDRANELCQLFCNEPAAELAACLASLQLADLPSDLDQESKRIVDHFLRSPTFFLAFDEATFLDGASVKSMSLRRILLSLSDQSRHTSTTPTGPETRLAETSAPKLAPLRVWTLMVDTHSGITDLLRPVDPSVRLISKPPLPPFSQLPFDLAVDRTIPSSAHDSLSLERLRGYGRPLWSHGVGTRDLLRLAKTKLLCAEKFSATNLDQVLAVLSQRIWIDLVYEQRFTSIETSKADADDLDTSASSNLRRAGYDVKAAQEYQGLATAGIRRHMRVFRYLTNQGLVVSVSPSEPALSLAARNCLLETSKYEVAIETFHKELVQRRGVINRGNLGEFICRLLLTMSMDFSVAAQGNASTTHAAIVPVKTFLQELLGEDLGMKGTSNSVLTQVEGAHLSFTHFTPFTDTLAEIDVDLLQDAWVRTMAWQCHPQQAGVDGILPIYCGDPDKAIDPSKFSYIAFQSKLALDPTLVKPLIRYTKPQAADKPSKRRRTEQEELPAVAQPTPAPTIQHVGCNVWGPPVVRSSLKRRPLVLHMDLGTKRPAGGSTELVSPFRVETDRAGAEKWLELLHPQDRDFSALHIRGLCRKRYPVLKHLGSSHRLLEELVSDKRDGRDEWLPSQTELDATYSYPPPRAS